MIHSSIYVGDNTHIVEVVELEDYLGVPQLDATVSMTAVIDSHGVAVSGVTVPLSLVHQGDALYRAVLPVGGAFVQGRVYRATIKATSVNGYKAEWVERLVAKVRAA